MPLSKWRWAPSGKVRLTLGAGVTGFRLDRLYWNPDSDLGWSVIAFLMRLTPANERR